MVDSTKRGPGWNEGQQGSRVQDVVYVEGSHS